MQIERSHGAEEVCESNPESGRGNCRGGLDRLASALAALSCCEMSSPPSVNPEQADPAGLGAALESRLLLWSSKIEAEAESNEDASP